MAILSYDGRFPQPWKRVDVDREIIAIHHIEGPEPVPVALTNEGDVYTLTEAGTDWSKIPGAGLLSEDATGLGLLNDLALHGDIQFVAGNARQLYRRIGLGAWETLSTDATAPDGYRPEDFMRLLALADGSLLIVSDQQPRAPNYDFLDDPRYSADMSVEEIGALMDRQNAEAAGGPPIKRLCHYTDANFRQIELPQEAHILDMFLDPAGQVWLFGYDGLLMRGTPEDGFQRLGFHGDMQTLLSATMFRNEMIFASDYTLHRFDGHRLTSLKPKLNDPFLNRNTPTPLRIQTVGDVMFYFDYKHGVCRWDGKTWDWIDIPPALLERDFKGLPTP
ncbi:hypothetical protein [Roseinatronobacter alkalisoli]|nr:hypothetical protein [Roseinatronobacter sp. HJB301]